VLFVNFDYPKLISNNKSLSIYNDIMAKGAISQWDIVTIDGKEYIEIDDITAVMTVKNLLKDNLKLDNMYEPLEDSILYSRPDVDVYVLNKYDEDEENFTLPNGGELRYKNPTVIVCSNYKLKTLFSRKVLEINKNSAYEIVYEEEFGKIIKESIKFNKVL